MAYVYLIDLQKFIGQRLQDAGDALKRSDTDARHQRFQEGRIQLLSEFQDFLASNYHHKLPRRIADRFKKINGTYTLE